MADSCQRCASDRVLSLGGKSSDLNNWSFRGHEGNGYVPYIPGVGGDDYYEIEVCLACGQLQGEWPQPMPGVEEEAAAEEADGE